MAKSFHKIISEGKLDVTLVDEEITLNLPEWLQTAAGALENEEKLLNWAQEEGILLGILQAGIQKKIIDLRAVARPAINVKTGKAKSLIADRENAQDRVNRYKVKPVPKPGKGKETELQQTCRVLKTVGQTDEQIIETLKQVFNVVEIKLALKSL